MSLPDLYKTLGETWIPTPESIRALYRIQAEGYAPEKLPTYIQKVFAARKMQRLNAAYRILHDPVQRLFYDKRLAAFAASAHSSGPPRRIWKRIVRAWHPYGVWEEQWLEWGS